jgi:hypothetical protein
MILEVAISHEQQLCLNDTFEGNAQQTEGGIEYWLALAKSLATRRN